MSVAEKLQIIAENQQKVYEAGKAAGGDTEVAYNEGFDDGKQAEYDRFWDDFQQNGTRADYKYAFSGTGWTEETLKPKYPIVLVDKSSTTRSALGMFNYLAWSNGKKTVDMTEICKKIDMSQALSAQYMFQMAYVENVTLDLSNVTTIYGMFAGNDGGYKNNITLTVSEKCTVYTNAFSYGSPITHLIFTDGSVIAANISLDRSNNLDDESIQSIINALQDRTGMGAMTVTFHTDVVAKLTDEQATTIMNKNWLIG